MSRSENCSEMRDLLALDEDLLEPGELALRDAHRSVCAECRAEAAALSAACVELGSVETPPVSPAVREKVLSAVEPKESSLEWLAGALVILACALGVAWVLGTPFEHSVRTDPPKPPLTEHQPPPDGGDRDQRGGKDGVIFYTTPADLELQAGGTDPGDLQPVGK